MIVKFNKQTWLIINDEKELKKLSGGDAGCGTTIHKLVLAHELVEDLKKTDLWAALLPMLSGSGAIELVY